jgi:hypothetical protein
VVAPPRFEPINRAALRCSLRLLISCWRSTRIGGDLSPPIVRLRRPILRTIEIAHQCCWRAAEDKVQTPMLMKSLADILDPHYGGCMRALSSRLLLRHVRDSH